MESFMISAKSPLMQQITIKGTKPKKDADLKLPHFSLICFEKENKKNNKWKKAHRSLVFVLRSFVVSRLIHLSRYTSYLDNMVKNCLNA